MTPYFHDDWLTVYGGDCRAVLRELEPESVHCVVTSPPYYSLRDYGVVGQIGLEPSLDDYVATMVGVMREVRRVMRPDATLWLNLGDAFGNKQLLGAPWRVAFALQADGWYLRSDIIWSKPNPMPESVTDRPTKSHEYLFLLSKSARYFWDADAVREPNRTADDPRRLDPEYVVTRERNVGGRTDGYTSPSPVWNPAGRNLRSVWTIATAPYPGAHFATFPPKLVEPCVKAGTSERGVCPECGAPWERVVAKGESHYAELGKRNGADFGRADSQPGNMGQTRTARGTVPSLHAASSQTTGWRPTCAHNAEPFPAVVMDIFAGTGTVGLVAQSLSRRAVLIDLNPDYLRQCLARNAQTPLGLPA